MRLFSKIRRIAVHDRRGFTLIEMIATLAILGILTAGVAALVQPSVNVFRSSTDNSRSSVICNNVLDILSAEFAYATFISLSGDTWSGGEVKGATSANYTSPIYGKMNFTNKLKSGKNSGIVELSVEDGTGMISLGEEFYMGMTVQVGLTAEKSNVLRVEIAAFDGKGQCIGQQYRYVKLLNTSV